MVNKYDKFTEHRGRPVYYRQVGLLNLKIGLFELIEFFFNIVSRSSNNMK
jgi:hypothetical protein